MKASDNLINYKEHYLYPAGIYTPEEPHKVTTILGTCVAVCLWDKVLGKGAINHYMLPLWNGEGLASPKYGNIAIERIVEHMIRNGSSIINLEAKVFGGKSDNENDMSVYNIGKRNMEIALRMLGDYGIRITAQSLGGGDGRKILFFTDTGKVLMKYLGKQ